MNRIIGVAAVVSGIGLSVGLCGAMAPFAPASQRSPTSVVCTADEKHRFIASNEPNQSGGMIVTLTRGRSVITDVSQPFLYGECRSTIFVRPFTKTVIQMISARMQLFGPIQSGEVIDQPTMSRRCRNLRPDKLSCGSCR
jgi:hypothetical protein